MPDATLTCRASPFRVSGLGIRHGAPRRTQFILALNNISSGERTGARAPACRKRTPRHDSRRRTAIIRSSECARISESKRNKRRFRIPGREPRFPHHAWPESRLRRNRARTSRISSYVKSGGSDSLSGARRSRPCCAQAASICSCFFCSTHAA